MAKLVAENKDSVQMMIGKDFAAFGSDSSGRKHQFGSAEELMELSRKKGISSSVEELSFADSFQQTSGSSDCTAG